jgi:type IV pilus assembly protein PilQ
LNCGKGVPFEIAQVDNFINIRFAPSAVPPKPLEKSAEPEWKQALEATAVEEAGGMDTDDATATDTAPMVTTAVGEIAADVARVDAEALRPPKTYTGEKIALNFFDTDIRNVFRIIGEISGENFAIDKNVRGKVTLQFDKPVPWDQVLDLVLRMNQLGMKRENGIFRIATLATLAREEQLEQQKLESRRSAEEQQELVTEFFLLSYINARETACAHLAASCSAGSADVGWPSKFSPRGSISVDNAKNMIIVNEIQSAIERIRTIIRILDQVTPQVLIEARIVEASSDFRRDVGFDWGTISIGSFDINDTFKVPGIDMEANNIPNDALDNGSIQWGLQKVTGTSFEIIDARIQVGETEGKTRTISSPKILTLDGRTARIQQGFQIPYLERDSAGGSSVEFQDVDLELSVTPNVTPDERVLLVVDIKKDDVLDVTSTQPPLSTNSAHTELLMENGETVVIGGVMKANTSEAGEGIPGLRKIPALGFFFGFNNKNDNQTELLIFLTPEIVKLAQREVQATNFSTNP